MKKKIVAFMAALSAFAVVAGTELKPADTNNIHVIRLSKLEWDNVRDCVETNGFCRIPSQNAAIVITNGLPNIETVLPILNNLPDSDLERNKLRIPVRGDDKKPVCPEPMPYIGQTI